MLSNLVRNYHPLLLQGETGVGKSYFAKKIFNENKEIFPTFIHVNIAALSENLFESELFGHKKGAFTGAYEDKIGFCQKVNNGILFLDEIGDLSLGQQTKLLTLIEEKIFYPVGSTKAQKFFGKLIFATNKNLQQMVNEKKFREDLFFRIRFFELELQPLRFKSLDNILDSLSDEYKLLLSVESRRCLVHYEWPGNYRELKQTFEYFSACNMKYVRMDDMPSWIKASSQKNLALYKHFMENCEESFLRNSLALNKGKVNQTSVAIELNKVTLISKLKKYGIDRRDYLNKLDEVSGF